MTGRAIIIIALLFGLASAFVIATLFGNKSQNSSRIVVALTPAKAGSVLDINQLKTINFPKNSLPEGSFSDPSMLVSRVAKQEIFSGEIILEPMLAPPNAKGGLASTIALGKRAITVRVNEVIAVAGFALPGSYVDVIATVKGSHENYVSKTVLNRVKVLAIAQETDAADLKPKVVSAVTLELAPKEAELLDLARSAGNLSLALRNTLDTSKEVSSGTTYQELVSQPNKVHEQTLNTSIATPQRKVVERSTNKPEYKVEVIKGSNKAEVAF